MGLFARKAAATDEAPFVRTAFRNILRREASDTETAHWAKVTRELGHGRVLELLFGSEEYAFRNRVWLRAEFDAGHFYSPVVDPEALAASGFAVDRSAPEEAVR